MELMIVGLNMELVNSLIWALTVLVKTTWGAAVGAVVLWGIVFVLSIFFPE